MEVKAKFGFIQISDLHIVRHRNLLEPLIDSINNEKMIDFVVVTGDLVHSCDNKLFDIAKENLDRINHRVIVIPGDYDYCDSWSFYFGDRYKYIRVKDYNILFMDTSFMRHRFFNGWGDLLPVEDRSQFRWFEGVLSNDNCYSLIFSHHPMIMNREEETHPLLKDNIRAVYSGHLHETYKVYFEYSKPKKDFKYGFSMTPMDFHGNSCYLLGYVRDDDQLVSVPKSVKTKITAW